MSEQLYGAALLTLVEALFFGVCYLIFRKRVAHKDAILQRALQRALDRSFPLVRPEPGDADE